MRIALVIGHTLVSGGAESYNHISEFEYNQELVGMVASNLADSVHDVLIFHRNNYRDLPAEINKKNPQIVICFHCNSFNTEVTGSEVLYYHESIQGKIIATKMVNAIHNCLGLRNRDTKPKRTEDKGGFVLRYTDAPCIILEPFFIDNPLDFSIGTDLKIDLALAISDTIRDLA